MGGQPLVANLVEDRRSDFSQTGAFRQQVVMGRNHQSAEIPVRQGRLCVLLLTIRPDTSESSALLSAHSSGESKNMTPHPACPWFFVYPLSIAQHRRRTRRVGRSQSNRTSSSPMDGTASTQRSMIVWRELSIGPRLQSVGNWQSREQRRVGVVTSQPKLNSPQLDSDGDGAEVLDAQDRSRLIISGNSSSMARWHSKLGLQPQPFVSGLSKLSVDGGIIVLMDLIIDKIFPLAFMPAEKGDRAPPWNEAEERVREEKWKVGLRHSGEHLANSGLRTDTPASPQDCKTR